MKQSLTDTEFIQDFDFELIENIVEILFKCNIISYRILLNSRSRISDNNDKRTELLYSEALSESRHEISTSFTSKLS